MNLSRLYHHIAGGTARAWLDHDDPTVGGLHPSDLGHTRIAEYWESFLPPLLKASDHRMAMEAAAQADTATPTKHQQSTVRMSSAPCDNGTLRVSISESGIAWSR